MRDEIKSELTEVDEALKVAQADPNRGAFFYDTFLNAPIYIPALSANQKPGEWKKLENSERFFPLYLRHEEARAVPVFDRLEKLKTWAENRAFDYLVLQAHVFLRVVAPEIAIVLNEGTPYRYLFTPEILEGLRKAMKPTTPH